MPDSKKMTEADLVTLLEAEERDSASYYDTDLASAQSDALARYCGDLYGDEIPGQSQVVSADVAETIDWIMPDIMRVFSSNEKAVSVEETKPQHEAYAEQASDYLNHVFFSDNPGEDLVYDFAFDGLLQRYGVIRADWKDGERPAPEGYQGLTAEQVATFESDPDVQITAIDSNDDGTFNVDITRQAEAGRVEVRVIAPENFRFSKSAPHIDESRYLAERKEATVSDLLDAFPEKKAMINKLPANDRDEREDDRRQARFGDDGDRTGSAIDAPGMSLLVLMDEFIRVDFDGDGHAELRNIKRVGTTVLENIEVDEHPFGFWTPLRIPHKMVGLSLYDKAKDTQRIKTTLKRKALDSVYHAVNPREFFDQNRIDAVEALLDNSPGRKIPVDGPPGDAVAPINVPDLSGSALRMMEFEDQERERKTGVNRNAQGMDPDALNKTATGIQLMQSASAGRVELYARRLADGLQSFFSKLLRLTIRFQDAPRTIKLRGEWVNVDPRTWDSGLRVSVHVGLGTGSREAKLGQLNLIAQKQEQILTTAGFNNPLVSIANYYATLSEIVSVMGFKTPDRFFIDPDTQDEAAAPQEPPPDPEILKAQAEIALKEKIAAAEQARKDAAQQADIERKVAQFEFERQLAIEQFEFERNLKQAQVEASVLAKGAGGVDAGKFGGAPG
jgi:hypothetical protein